MCILIEYVNLNIVGMIEYVRLGNNCLAELQIVYSRGAEGLEVVADDLKLVQMV